MPIKVNWAWKNERYKQNMVKVCCANGIKMIFTLLTKVIAVNVRFSVI